MTKKEYYKKYKGTRLAIDNINQRNKARRFMVNKLMKKKVGAKRLAEMSGAQKKALRKQVQNSIKGKDVDHKNHTLGKVLDNKPSNLRLMDSKKNRGKDANIWRRITATAY